MLIVNSYIDLSDQRLNIETVMPRVISPTKGARQKNSRKCQQKYVKGKIYLADIINKKN